MVLAESYQDKFLDDDSAKSLVLNYVSKEQPASSTQSIIDSGVIPRLKGYVVRPGKVSDSIHGGRGSYENKKTKVMIEYDNPPLISKDGKPLRLMVRTDRISTHDINRGSIPFKDQILATNHNFMRRMLAPVLGTSQYDIEGLADNSVVIAAEDLEQIRFENVIRAYMARSTTSTSLFVHYMNGERNFCGHSLPNDLFPNGSLPYIMDTPSTKSDEHDESLSPEKLFEYNICSPEAYAQIRNNSLVAFGIVQQFLKTKGLMPVDTKTEHGWSLGRPKIKSQDEIWTMDSSRFWLIDDYETQLNLFKSGDEKGLVDYLKTTQPGIKEKDYTLNGRVVMSPKSFSKEFARGFSQGEKGYTDEQRIEIAVRYIMGIQHLLGKRFEPDMKSRDERVISGLQKVVEEIVA